MNDNESQSPNTNDNAPVVPTATDAPKSVSSAADFRRAREARENGEFVTLSDSGLTVKLKRPAVSQLVKTGQIPSELVNASAKVQAGNGSATQADYQKYVQYQEHLIRYSVVEPQLVDANPTDDQITMDDLTDTDKGEIVIYVNGGLAALAKFRFAGQGVSA
jgi:hypothetical protein